MTCPASGHIGTTSVPRVHPTRRICPDRSQVRPSTVPIGPGWAEERWKCVDVLRSGQSAGLPASSLAQKVGHARVVGTALPGRGTVGCVYRVGEVDQPHGHTTRPDGDTGSSGSVRRSSRQGPTPSTGLIRPIRSGRSPTAGNWGNCAITLAGRGRGFRDRPSPSWRVVEGVTAGDDVVVHPFECGDGLALLFADAQLIAGDVIVLDRFSRWHRSVGQLS